MMALRPPGANSYHAFLSYAREDLLGQPRPAPKSGKAKAGPLDGRPL
jgi:hypothetical protein